MNKLKLLKLYLWTMGICLLFWWPLSHWFYPEWYHHVLGFASYDDAFVKVIGTTGVMPVLGILYVAQCPVKRRNFIPILTMFSLLMAGTYIYLIRTGHFPQREYFNVGLCVFSALSLILLYPRPKAPVKNIRKVL